MSMTIVSGRHFAGLASLAAPVLVFVIAKVVGLGPLISQAQSDDMTTEPEIEAKAEQLKLPAAEPRLQPPADSAASLTRSRELRKAPAAALTSPFYQPIVREEPPEQKTAPVEPSPSAPTFVLSGIMNSRPPIAVIDGDVHRVGDDLGDGWRVESIDARALAVVLRHQDGREHRLTTGRP